MRVRAAPFLPLPLAGEVDALEERGGWGNASASAGARGETPTPALPRKRERGKSQRNTSSNTGNPMITAAAISA
jgi:hypothetical protein